MTAHRRDLISGILFALLAVGLFIYASGFPVPKKGPVAVGPGFYPRILAGLLGVFSAIQIIQALIKEATTKSHETDHIAPFWKDRTALILFLLTLASLILFPFVIRLLGFAITSFLFLSTLIYLLSKGNRSGRSRYMILVITLGITVVTYFVFRAFLQIPFPQGIFGS